MKKTKTMKGWAVLNTKNKVAKVGHWYHVYTNRWMAEINLIPFARKTHITPCIITYELPDNSKPKKDGKKKI